MKNTTLSVVQYNSNLMLLFTQFDHMPKEVIIFA